MLIFFLLEMLRFFFINNQCHNISTCRFIMETVCDPCSEKTKINCEIHTDVQIDHFCSQHDVVCCRVCLSDSHRSCESVLPLDSASKDVRNSSLLSDTLEEQDYMTETLQKIEENRDENKKLLKQKKSLIIKQISAAKSKVLKYLDDIEERLITEVESVQEKTRRK